MGLSDYRVGPAIAVSDMKRAREFYEGKLGLSGGTEGGDGGVTYDCAGGTTIHVYPGDAGSSSSTRAGWDVDDLEKVVDELTSNGVTFEQYDEGPIQTDDKGIATIDDDKAAWFKDPDGNVLGLVQA
jgi:catechol 2,3-dioxygenase-like lactoylglutathione lyase family enzyme